MRDFFLGWKRKLGCVTLVIACVFAAGWVRGLLQVGDRFVFPWRTSYTVIFVSNDMISVVPGISIRHYHLDEKYNPGPMRTKLPEWVSFKRTNPADALRKKAERRASVEWSEANNWDVSWLGFGLDGSIIHSAMTIPYWSIVIPLTLLSAWLLLSKPRSGKPVPTSEPQTA